MEWWERSLTLDGMIAHKAAFLESPGCDVDLDGVASELDSDAEESELLDAWFDRVVESLRGDVLVLHRHQTVSDVGAYVRRLEAGEATVGVHWSLDQDTFSPDPDQSEREIMLRGAVDADQVEWFATFQAMFSHPWERQVWFQGPIRLDRIQDLGTGEFHVLSTKPYPISIEEPEALAPAP